ncbi:hypothetical protein BH20ACT8_BH20ACT8_14630 [soil metagenome]
MAREPDPRTPDPRTDPPAAEPRATDPRSDDVVVEERRSVEAPVPAKTSAAAAFALVFGLSALICAVAVISAPVAVLFGIIAIILGVVGRGRAKREWHVTGSGVAMSGIILGVLGLLLGGLIIAGVATFLSNPELQQDLRQQIEQQLEEQGVDTDD